MKIYLQILFFSTLFLFFNYNGFAQIIEKRTDPQVLQLFEEARTAQKNENHELANKKFRQLIELKKNLPQSMAFYFSETLYELGQYQNAFNFIEKYLALTGRKGDYYNQALTLKSVISQSLNKQKTCQLCNRFGYRWKTCDHCQNERTILEDCPTCRAVGSIICPSCKGQGVLISKNTFGVDEYKTCHVCQLQRRIDCPRCQGNKKINSPCPVCLGSGQLASSTICDHKDDGTHTHDHPEKIDPLSRN